MATDDDEIGTSAKDAQERLSPFGRNHGFDSARLQVLDDPLCDGMIRLRNDGASHRREGSAISGRRYGIRSAARLLGVRTDNPEHTRAARALEPDTPRFDLLARDEIASLAVGATSNQRDPPR
jgi:hypothetical protein